MLLDSRFQIGSPASTMPAIHTPSELTPQATGHALRERIKELNCLYTLTRLAEQHHRSLTDFLQSAARILPHAWQYPDCTCARIIWTGQAFTSEGFRTSPWRQAANIRGPSSSGGSVEIFYLQEMPASDEGPFLKEERALIEAVAEHIGAAVIRQTAQAEIQESHRLLTLERQSLKEANHALRTILNRIEEEKKGIHRDIQMNVEKILLPLIQGLSVRLPRPQRKVVELLRSSLEEMTSPFIRALGETYHALTPTEMHICKLIRDGLRTKEIAHLRGVSPATINRHREHIRRKLGVANSNINLVTHLQATL